MVSDGLNGDNTLYTEKKINLYRCVESYDEDEKALMEYEKVCDVQREIVMDKWRRMLSA